MGITTIPRPYIAPADPQGAGTAIWVWREAHGLTTRELAELLGVANGAVSQWENSKRKVPGWVPMALLGVELTLLKTRGIGVCVTHPGKEFDYVASVPDALEKAAALWDDESTRWVDVALCFRRPQ